MAVFVAHEEDDQKRRAKTHSKPNDVDRCIESIACEIAQRFPRLFGDERAALRLVADLSAARSR